MPEKENRSSDRLVWLQTAVPMVIAALCVVAALGLVSYKTLVKGYRLAPIDSEETWIIRLTMDVAGAKEKLVVRAMRPLETPRQKISGMTVLGQGFDITEEDGYAVWRKDEFDGRAHLVMRFRAKTEARRVSLPVALDWNDMASPAESAYQYVKPSERIQSDHPEIRALGELLRSSSEDVAGFLRALYDYTRKTVEYTKVGGPTDALTCLRLQEGSCNGKNRLLVAVARAQGLPARICKGVILQRGTVKTESHSWSEVYIDGQWVPICPTGGYFAEIPERYLEYPREDRTMFSYTKNVKFDRVFQIDRSSTTPEEAFKSDLDNPDHILHAWGSLGDADFSLSLLMIILTVPVGVTVVCFLRHVVGLVPFGTFLPALIAVSFRDMGLGWGMLQFVVVVLICVLLNAMLKKFRLLHFPRISVIFCCVVFSILFLAVWMNRLGYHRAAKVGMFPLAILTLTTERFSLMYETDSLRSAAGRMFATLLCAVFCYFPMMSFTIRSIILVFPETLLLCVAVCLLLGLYTGLRLREFIRFRLLMGKGGCGGD